MLNFYLVSSNISVMNLGGVVANPADQQGTLVQLVP
jgi:hypothetical protein